MGKHSPITEARLFANTDRSGPCWLWTGYISRDGQPRSGGGLLVLPVVYRLYIGAVPPGHIRRSCGEERCVNPEHLISTGSPEYFWSFADSAGAGCWEWRGGIHASGYGQFAGGYAHREAYRLTKGEIPAGLFVCHTCDNRACVRPDHLFLGTNADNMADMVAKGRKRGRPRKNPTPAPATPARVFVLPLATHGGGR